MSAPYAAFSQCLSTPSNVSVTVSLQIITYFNAMGDIDFEQRHNKQSVIILEMENVGLWRESVCASAV